MCTSAARLHSCLRTQGFYTAHGENALYIARTFYKTTSVLRYYGAAGNRQQEQKHQQGQLASVSLNRHLFESALRELLLEGAEHCVEVYEGTGASWRLAK